MSELPYITKVGAGEKLNQIGHYSQVVVIGNIAKCSGQGGWDDELNLDKFSWQEQIDNAFDNVDKVLQAAGFRGWEDVYLLRSYQVDIANHFDYLVEKLKKRIPGHSPLWTALSVPRLAFGPMSVELEVEAIKNGGAA